MSLFKISGTTVKQLGAKSLDLERNLQRLFEDNLQEILHINFLAHEYSTSFGGRIDTLGIDSDGSPCIIEYKKSKDDNVINQGLSYLRWLLDHKADFEMLCSKKKVTVDVDWDSPRVICIAESYNKFDLDTVDILPINVELLRYRIYDGSILLLEPATYQKVRISTTSIIKKGRQQKESSKRLQKTYSVEDHLQKSSEHVRSLFLKLREKILGLDEAIKEEPKKHYIAYKLATNFVDIQLIRSKDIKVFLNIRSGQLNDLNNIARDLTKPKPVGHWGNGDYEVRLETDEQLVRVFELIKQSYDSNK